MAAQKNSLRFCQNGHRQAVQRSVPDQAVSAYRTPAKTAYLQVATTAHTLPYSYNAHAQAEESWLSTAFETRSKSQ